MTIVQSIILGIVEGLTEFLPISSTAHMDITRVFLNIPSSEFVKSFEIIIQLGAILAVVVIYGRKVFSSWSYMRNLVIAFLPTGIIGFMLYTLIKSHLLGNIAVQAWALLIGGIIIVLFENYAEKQKMYVEKIESVEKLSLKKLLTLGAVQALAVIPGVSRSGAVIIAGRSLGLSTLLITEFSFLLAVPTMLAASGYDILKSGVHFSNSEWGIILSGFVTSFICALFVIRWFLSYIRKHSFTVFGWYRICIGILLLLAMYTDII